MTYQEIIPIAVWQAMRLSYCAAYAVMSSSPSIGMTGLLPVTDKKRNMIAGSVTSGAVRPAPDRAAS